METPPRVSDIKPPAVSKTLSLSRPLTDHEYKGTGVDDRPLHHIGTLCEGESLPVSLQDQVVTKEAMLLKKGWGVAAVTQDQPRLQPW